MAQINPISAEEGNFLPLKVFHFRKKGRVENGEGKFFPSFLIPVPEEGRKKVREEREGKDGRGGNAMTKKENSRE